MGGVWKGLRSDPMRTRAEDGKAGRFMGMQDKSFYSSDCVVKEKMNFILKDAYLCYFAVILNFSSNVVECPTIQSGSLSSKIAPHKLSPNLAASQPATVQEVKQILTQIRYIQR